MNKANQVNQSNSLTTLKMQNVCIKHKAAFYLHKVYNIIMLILRMTQTPVKKHEHTNVGIINPYALEPDRLQESCILIV